MAKMKIRQDGVLKGQSVIFNPVRGLAGVFAISNGSAEILVQAKDLELMTCAAFRKKCTACGKIVGEG